MKTNYAKLGQEAMARLEASCSRAAFVQQALLEGLLRRNRDTVYGGNTDLTPSGAQRSTRGGFRFLLTGIMRRTFCA